jgi:hypothetical protein
LYRIGAVKREWSVIALRLGDAFWGLLDWDGAYDEEEKRRKGLVSLNACTAAMQSLSDDAAHSSISATYILHPWLHPASVHIFPTEDFPTKK